MDELFKSLMIVASSSAAVIGLWYGFLAWFRRRDASHDGSSHHHPAE